MQWCRRRYVPVPGRTRSYRNLIFYTSNIFIHHNYRPLIYRSDYYMQYENSIRLITIFLITRPTMAMHSIMPRGTGKCTVSVLCRARARLTSFRCIRDTIVPFRTPFTVATWGVTSAVLKDNISVVNILLIIFHVLSVVLYCSLIFFLIYGYLQWFENVVLVGTPIQIAISIFSYNNSISKSNNISLEIIYIKTIITTRSSHSWKILPYSLPW